MLINTASSMGKQYMKLQYKIQSSYTYQQELEKKNHLWENENGQT